MKRTFTILTAAFALLAFLAIPMGMWGQTSVTWPGTTALPGTATAVANDQNVTIMVSSTNTYTNPIRIYANTTVTINASNGAKILSVAYEASSTGNYVTYAQGATVTPNVTPAVSGKIVTWTYAESDNVTEFTFKPSSQTRSSGITITYIIPGATPTCATPTFSPAAGTYTQPQSVSISCTTEDATIYYTTNGDNPTANSLVYTEAISVSSNTTIKAMAVAQGYENSAIATAEYAFITLDHAGTLEDPYTVADARNAIDANTGTQGVYATGIVSAIPSAWSTDFSNITFNFVDNVGDNNFLQAYRCASGTGVDASTVAVGDIVVVHGNLIKYGSTYEFGQGCQLVSLTHPSVPSITVTPALVELNATGEEGAQMVTLSITCENIQVETDFAFGIQYYDVEGIEQNNPTWMVSGVNGTNDEGYFVNLTILDNYDEARSAYLKVHVSDNNGEEVYSNLVTVNQEAPELPHVTWDLSIDETATATTTEMTWTSNYATMGVQKANATTNTNNYYPGTEGHSYTSTRFYTNSVLTISPVAGYAITSVVFTATTTGYASALENSTWTNATASADDKTVTVTPTDGPTAMVATIGGTCGFTSVTVYYEENNVPAIPSVTVTPNVVNATADETEGTLTITYENIPELISFDYYFCDPNGGELEGDDPDWIYAEINEPGEEENYTVTYIIGANQGEARTAYMKVYTFDDDLEEVYAIVTVNQAAAPQQYTLTVEPFENLELITFVNDEMVMEGDGEIQVTEGDQIMLSIVADEGYVMQTLMVNGVNHVNDIADDFTYTFDMPAEDVTISATAVEDVAPAGGNYVRITALDQLTDGSKVIIAARYDEEHTNGYFAMSGVTSGKPTGVAFTSETSGNDEILPAAITASEDTYYWTVNVTDDGYTFTNADNQMIGYNSGTNFATGGDNTEWAITIQASEEGSMVPNYTGFVISNVNNEVRAFALNSNHNFGPYHTQNMSGSGYNFFLDFFVQQEPVETASYELSIVGYTDVEGEGINNRGYYLIASPVTVDPATVEGMTDGDFDLYYFDQAESDEWRNYEAQAFDLVPGKGYLYAKKATDENPNYNFTLTGIPYSGIGEIELEKADDVEFSGWNLIGNPFGSEAILDMPFYRMAVGGSALSVQIEANSSVAAMEGVFVEAENHGDKATFTALTPGIAVGDGIDMKNVAYLNLNISKNLGGFVDNAIVRFDNGAMLGKFQLNQNSTKLYITENGKDYAIVRSANEGEMPVNFKAEQDGTYTLNFTTENVSFGYLHLIDNMTGVETDLLQTPSYSFVANTGDNASRFRLVFSANGVEENTAADSFAFFNGSEWVISNTGNATLQVIDLMGRVLSTETISGNTEVSISQVPGVYMIRLVNGDIVKVQKVIVR